MGGQTKSLELTAKTILGGGGGGAFSLTGTLFPKNVPLLVICLAESIQKQRIVITVIFGSLVN